MGNKKRFPLALMLLAGAVAGVMLYRKDVTLLQFLWGLLITIIVFYIIGRVAVYVIDRFDKENAEAEERKKAEEEAEKEKDGSVIEKETKPQTPEA